jgi:hypothetical protein
LFAEVPTPTTRSSPLGMVESPHVSLKFSEADAPWAIQELSLDDQTEGRAKGGRGGREPGAQGGQGRRARPNHFASLVLRIRVDCGLSKCDSLSLYAREEWR